MATEQGELASMMEGEDFHAPDENFLFMAEKLHNEEHRLVLYTV